MQFSKGLTLEQHRDRVKEITKNFKLGDRIIIKTITGANYSGWFVKAGYMEDMTYHEDDKTDDCLHFTVRAMLQPDDSEPYTIRDSILYQHVVDVVKDPMELVLYWKEYENYN